MTSVAPPEDSDLDVDDEARQLAARARPGAAAEVPVPDSAAAREAERLVPRGVLIDAVWPCPALLLQRGRNASAALRAGRSVPR
jgi:hypothetical protein